MNNIINEKLKLIKDNYEEIMKNKLATHLNKSLRYIVYSVLTFLGGQSLLVAVDMKILPEDPPFIVWLGTAVGFVGIILTIITIRFYFVLKKELHSESERMWIKIKHNYNKLMEADYFRHTPTDEILNTLLVFKDKFIE